MRLKAGHTKLSALVAIVGLLLTFSGYISANSRGPEVKAGTILKLSMDTYLTSRTAELGDPFTATVFEDVRIGNEIAIPKGTKIEGKVSSVKPAERKSKSGTLGIDFDRIRLANGQAINIEGQLTSLDAAEKRQIDEEGRVAGGSSSKRNVVFIGGGAAGGAAIGAIAGGGSGAAIGAGVGAAAGILGSIFSKGEEAQVMSGQKFGMELLRTVLLPDPYNNASNDRDRFDDRDRNNSRDDDRPTQTPSRANIRGADLKSTALLKRAQKSLLDLNYYKGPLNGINGPSTRTAVRAFQRDYDLEQTGDLDLDTAYQLGLVNEDGIEILPVRILNATADKQRDSIRVKANAEANSGGWQIYTSTQVDGDQLHVYVTGAPPFGGSTQALTRYPVDVPPVRDDGFITKVVVHGDGNPVTISLATPSLEISRSIKQQTTQLFDSYREAISVTSRTSKTNNFTRLTENQALALSALSNLSNSASFVELLLTSKATDPAIKGALQTLMREARQTRRAMEDGREFSRVERAWLELEKDLRKIGDNYQVNYERGNN
ncbi:MAG: peptidoglycan-binding protein [Acidobacteria bacterium]|nr:peptidoglycan-binding protein [Acidobacteriota bacterium]